MKQKVVLIGAAVLAAVGVAFLGLHEVAAEGAAPLQGGAAASGNAVSAAVAARPTEAQPTPAVTSDNTPPPVPGVLDGVAMTYDPFKPSDGPYPRLNPGEKIWIDVSIDQQLVYLFHGAKRIYTMVTSSGMEWRKGDGSPLGVYHIQHKRGTWFYVPHYGEGAEYWVSWLGNGIYLFHSVPMNKERQVIPSIAARMLHEASHGCFHLTIPDAKWFYEHIPYRSTVIVERAPVRLAGNTIYRPSPDQTQAIEATES